MPYLTLPWKQAALADAMSEISEECYCAGWLIGTEFVLWAAVLDGPRAWGMGFISADDIARLKGMSDEIGGWIEWSHDDDPELSGEQFVPMAEWVERFARVADQYRAAKGEGRP